MNSLLLDPFDYKLPMVYDITRYMLGMGLSGLESRIVLLANAEFKNAKP